MSEQIARLVSSVEGAAQMVRQVLIGFLFALIYIVIALGQTTDLRYLLKQGQELPIIGVTVPMDEFFRWVPVLVVLLHLSVLFQWSLLQGRADALKRVLLSAGSREQTRTTQVMTPYHFLPVFVPHGFSRSVRATATLLAALLLVIAPLAILIGVQVRCLGFHDPVLTVLQRASVGADLVLLWWFRPFGWPTAGARMRQVSRGLTLGGTALIAYFVGFDAVIPGASVTRLPQIGNMLDWCSADARCLVLRGAAVKSEQRDEAGQPLALNLEGQDFRHADLSGASLINVDLHGADFSWANLSSAKFVDARFAATRISASSGSKSRQGTRFRFTYAAGAQFDGLDLSKVDFTGARLLAASFAGCQLSETVFRGSNAEAVNFSGANLYRANLRLASLAGADFRHAQLVQADLIGADLRGAVFQRTFLTRARFHLADLTWATFGAMTPAAVKELGLKVAAARPKFLVEDWMRMALEPVSANAAVQGLSRDQAMLLNFDFLAVPSAPFCEALAPADFHRLWQALALAEVAEVPELASLLAARDVGNEFLVAASVLRQRGPAQSLPGQEGDEVLRGLLVDPFTLFSVRRSTTPEVGDGRYRLWSDDPARRVTPPAAPESWIHELIQALRENANRTQVAAIVAMAAEAGNTLAGRSWLRLVSPPSNPGTDAMPDARFLTYLPKLKRGSLDAATMMALADWTNIGTEEGLSWLRRAADAGSARAQGLLGLKNDDKSLLRMAQEAFDVVGSKQWALAQSITERGGLEFGTTSWQALGYAALRGDSDAAAIMGQYLVEKRDYAPGIRWLRRAVDFSKTNYVNALAWTLATCPERELQEPDVAVRLIENLCHELYETDWSAAKAGPDAILQRAQYLDTWAAALAASGDFRRAIEIQEEAMAAMTAMSAGAEQANSRADFQRHLTAYREGRAWIDYPLIPGAP